MGSVNKISGQRTRLTYNVRGEEEEEYISGHPTYLNLMNSHVRLMFVIIEVIGCNGGGVSAVTRDFFVFI